MKRIIICISALLVGMAEAQNTNGAWLGSSNSNWSNPANWQGGNIADGVGALLTIMPGASGNATLSHDGNNGLRTVGSIFVDSSRAITLNTTPGGANPVRLDNDGNPIYLSTSAQSAAVSLNGPFTVADNSTVVIDGASSSVFNFFNMQRVYGNNLLIEHRSTGTGNNATATQFGNGEASGNNDFTAEFHNYSATKTLNFCGGAPDETRLGNARNSIWMYPGASIAIRNSDNTSSSCLNPLRTIYLEGTAADVCTIEQSPNQASTSHIPGDIMGDAQAVIGSYLLSGRNRFSSLKLSGLGITMISSDTNLGDPQIPLTLEGEMLFILGRNMKNFGKRPVTFTSGSGTFNLGMGIVHPANSFTLDKLFATSRGVNSPSNTGLFAKHGMGELILSTPQTVGNTGNGIYLRLFDGTVTVDYAAGAYLRNNGVDSGNNIGFAGGTLLLRGTGTSTNLVQNLGHFHLDCDTAVCAVEKGGGRLIIDQSGATGTFTLNFATFNNASLPQRYAGTLAITTFEDTPGQITITSTEANDASGIIGNGRVTLNKDFPSQVGGNVIGPATYTPLALADNTQNASLTGSAVITADTTVNTLKITSTAPGQSLTLDEGVTLFLENAAILFDGDYDYTITGGALRSLRLETQANNTPLTTRKSNVIIHNVGTGTLYLETPVIGADDAVACFTKAGPGTLVVTNTFFRIAGPTFINEGTLVVENHEALGRVVTGTLSGVTSSTSSSEVTCTMNELPPEFVPGRSLLANANNSRYVGSITGSSGAWIINLVNNNGAAANAMAATSNGDITFTTDELKSPLCNNGRLRILAPILTAADANARRTKGGTFDVADGQIHGVGPSGTGSAASLIFLDNTDTAGNGVLRIQGTPPSTAFGAGLYLRRGIFETHRANSSHGLSTISGIAPLMFADANIAPATLRLYSPSDQTVKIAVAELSGTNPSAIIEQSGNRSILFAVCNGGDNTFGGIMRDRDPSGAALPQAKINFLKAGAGTLALTGAHTYTGTTTINGGVLQINGSLVSAVTINKGAINGTGTIPSLTVEGKGAAVAPGVGPLTVTGDVTFRGDILVDNVETIEPGVYPLYACGGLVTLDTISVANPLPNRRYKLAASNTGLVSLSISVPGAILMVR